VTDAVISCAISERSGCVACSCTIAGRVPVADRAGRNRLAWGASDRGAFGQRGRNAAEASGHRLPGCIRTAGISAINHRPGANAKRHRRRNGGPSGEAGAVEAEGQGRVQAAAWGAISRSGARWPLRADFPAWSDCRNPFAFWWTCAVPAGRWNPDRRGRRWCPRCVGPERARFCSTGLTGASQRCRYLVVEHRLK
jgi:hypothetical protein